MKKLILIFILLAQAPEFAKAVGAPAVAAEQKTYEKRKSMAKYDLGPQCAYGTKEEWQGAEAKNSPSVDLISYPQFIKNMKDQKLLDPAFFSANTKLSLRDAKKAISTILSETQKTVDSKEAESVQKCFMNAKEIFSLYYYTGEGYKIINTALRKKDLDLLARTNILRAHLESALAKLKPYVGYIKRIQSSNPEQISDFKSLKTIDMLGYTSTSIGNPVFPGNTSMVMKTSQNSRCHYIADFSLVETLKQEEEVLCQPDTQFKTIWYTEVDSYNEVLMEETTR